jgi:protein tyrosine kinase modulator
VGAYRLSDIISAFWRRLWILLLTAGLIGPLALAIAYFLPPKFQSTATVLVESQQVALATSTVTVAAAERLQVIQQRLMTRENLLDLIAKYNLYAERTDLSLTEKVELVRSDTSFNTIPVPGAPRGTASVLAFTITFTSAKSSLTAQVASELVTKILEANAKARTDRASETLGYFDQEVKRLSDALGVVEAGITRFKNENEKALPESLAFRRQELSNIKTRMATRDNTRLGYTDQKQALEDALRTGQIGALSGQPLSREEQDLLALRNQLVQSQATLAESHPTIIALKARIAALEKVVAPSNDNASAQASLAVQRTQQQITLLERQIALLDEQQQADATYQKELEASIAATPQVEITLNALLRKQTQLQQEYDIAVNKRNAASEGERLEVNQQAERFELVEPPQVPERPVSPNRPLIAAGGIAGSVMLGLGLMALFELLNTSIRTAHALEYRTGLRPVVTIPYVMTRSERLRRRLRWGGFVLLFLVAIPAALYAVDRYYLPLGTLLERLVSRTGIDGMIRLIEIRLGR